MVMYSFNSDVTLWRNPENRKATKATMTLGQAMDRMQKLGYDVTDYRPDDAGFIMEYENPKTHTTYTIIYAQEK